MLSVLDDLIRRHRETGILIDANLLLVFLLTAWNKDVALQFKRTKGYSAQDLELLVLVLSEFKRWVVTPSVLAEVSNLAAGLRGAHRSDFFEFLQVLLPQPQFDERHVGLASVARAACFVRLRFADATVEQLGASGVPVITEDFDLYQHLVRYDIEAINFNHLRVFVL